MAINVDVIIIGGGLVGLTCAHALKNSPLKIAVINNAQPNWHWDSKGYDARVSAINRASEIVFRNLGVWDAMVTTRVSPYRKMQVWDGDQGGEIVFDAAFIAEPNLGHIIENRVMLKALFQSLESHSRIELIYPHKPEELWHKDESIFLQLDNGEQLSAKVLIGADGARSWCRRAAGFDVMEKPYDHSAVVATVKTQQPHQQTARQRFFSQDVLAFLPLSDPHTHSIVWSTTPDKAERCCQWEDDVFKTQLTEAFQGKCGGVMETSQRFQFPLVERHGKQYVKPRIALIGDAAHTIHPLAGQGVNLGLMDACALAEVLTEANAKGRDVGLLPTLRKYERARKGENSVMLWAMNGFKQLFSHSTNSVAWARSMGLTLTDKATPIKYLLVKKAMGIIGEVPALAKIK